MSVAVDAVLAESEDLALCLTGVRVFRAGLDFGILAMSRTAGANRGPGGLSAGVFGHGDPQDRLLLGIEYADGRAVHNVGAFGPGLDPALDDIATPVLMPGSGGGGERSVDLSFYLSPLPPPGPLRIITAWPGRGLPETVTEVAAERFIEAAPRVRVLWELDDVDQLPGPPPPPDVPPGSWFDHHR